MMTRTTAISTIMLTTITTKAGAANAQIELSAGESQHLKVNKNIKFGVRSLGVSENAQSQQGVLEKHQTTKHKKEK